MRQPRSVYDARWAAKNPGYAAKFYAANKARIAEKARAYYLANRARIIERVSQSYHSMTEEERIEHNRKRRERHAQRPDVRNKVERLRDHNLRTTECITPEGWAQILTIFDNACIYCGSTEAITVEHLTPISRGGTNDLNNLRPACLSCNSSKRDKTPEEYFTWMASR